MFCDEFERWDQVMYSQLTCYLSHNISTCESERSHCVCKNQVMCCLSQKKMHNCALFGEKWQILALLVVRKQWEWKAVSVCLRQADCTLWCQLWLVVKCSWKYSPDFLSWPGWRWLFFFQVDLKTTKQQRAAVGFVGCHNYVGAPFRHWLEMFEQCEVGANLNHY